MTRPQYKAKYSLMQAVQPTGEAPAKTSLIEDSKKDVVKTYASASGADALDVSRNNQRARKNDVDSVRKAASADMLRDGDTFSNSIFDGDVTEKTDDDSQRRGPSAFPPLDDSFYERIHPKSESSSPRTVLRDDRFNQRVFTTGSDNDESMEASLYDNCNFTNSPNRKTYAQQSDNLSSPVSVCSTPKNFNIAEKRQQFFLTVDSASEANSAQSSNLYLDAPDQEVCDTLKEQIATCSHNSSPNLGAVAQNRAPGSDALEVRVRTVPPSYSSTSLNARRLSNSQRYRTPSPRPSMEQHRPSVFADGNENVPSGLEDDADKKETKVHSGPSSKRTVLIIAGLFVVGLIFILSGIVVLSVEEHTAFRVAGSFFMGLGTIFLIICLILQKKNVKKLVNQLENDLYFLNVTDNKIWNMIFHFDEQLHW